MNYIGLKCPVCGKTFTADDDIVVCPVCGAPYHRACYAKVGKCVFEDKHGTPDAWSPPAREEAPHGNPNGDPQSKTKRCPRCGMMNSSSAVFCEHCGLPLNANQPFRGGGVYPPPGGAPNGSAPFGQVPPGGYPGQPPFAFDPMGGVNPNEPIGSVPAGDVAKFVRNNTQYYLPVFMNLKKFARNRFNFTAFLFPCIWAMYRKMYKIGSVITGIMAALYVIYIYMAQAFVSPLYKSIISEVGGDPDTFTMTGIQMQEFINKIYLLPSQKMFLIFVPTIILIIHLAIKLFVGFKANKTYLKHSVGTIRDINKNVTQPGQAAAEIYRTGGVNTFAVVCFIIGCFILYYVTPILV